MIEARIKKIPRRKQLSKRGRERRAVRRRAMCVWGNVSKLLAGKAASATPPTLTTHSVAMVGQW